MAITRYSTFDKTVDTIAERNAIVNRVNHMTVVVKDAIADPSAGAGKAIYRWDAVDNVWILVAKSTYETISFITEEITIANGEVQLSNYPVDNKVWDAVILDGTTIIGNLNLSLVSVSNSKITNIDSTYNGNKLRVTYAYSSIAVQINEAIEDKVDAVLLNNVKTINGVEIIGTGNIVVEGVLPEMKTINSESILGSGDITISTAFADITSKPTTISGYGITDAYTKTEVESKIVELSPPTDISMKADITYVDSKVAGIVDSSPETLNTLNEFAAALGDDPNFATTISNQIGTKANSADVYTKTQVDSSLNTKVDKITGKGLSTEDYTTAEKTKLSEIESGAQVNTVTSVSGKTGVVTLVKGDVGLGNVDNTADSSKNVLSATKLATARSISLSGDVTGTVSFDGSANVTITATIADDSHNHIISNIDGLQGTLDNKVDKITGKGLSTEDYTSAEKSKLASIENNANNYILPVASSTVLGGVKAGTNISIDANGVISANDTSVAWSEITSKPTTLSGYGITDPIQSTLVSGTNIKTINGTSVLGSGNIVTTQTTITGNAGTATKLQTARTINGVSFDGSANISVNTNNSEIIKFDSGTTEGTDLYTFNGSSAKTINIIAGTNVSLTKAAGSITINAINANNTSVAWSEITSKPTTLSGYGITDPIQSTLVSGTNIKTINGTSILGSGDIELVQTVNWNDIQNKPNTVMVNQSFIATAGQTTYSINYSVGSLTVFVNGVKLTSSDFVATNGTSIVFAEALQLGNVVDIVGYVDASTLTVYNKTEVDTLVGDLTLLLDAINGESI